MKFSFCVRHFDHRSCHHGNQLLVLIVPESWILFPELTPSYYTILRLPIISRLMFSKCMFQQKPWTVSQINSSNTRVAFEVEGTYHSQTSQSIDCRPLPINPWSAATNADLGTVRLTYWIRIFEIPRNYPSSKQTKSSQLTCGGPKIIACSLRKVSRFSLNLLVINSWLFICFLQIPVVS